jgi:hypothetical protein
MPALTWKYRLRAASQAGMPRAVHVCVYHDTKCNYGRETLCVCQPDLSAVSQSGSLFRIDHDGGYRPLALSEARSCCLKFRDAVRGSGEQPRHELVHWLALRFWE